MEVKKLAELIKVNCFNRKITITGGEPLDQLEPLTELLQLLDGYDICLYTGYDMGEVPEQIKKHLKYLKTGAYIKSLHSSTTPYIGSTNQQFIQLTEDR